MRGHRRGAPWAAVLFFVLLPAGCSELAPHNRPVQVIVKSAQLGLAWDPPGGQGRALNAEVSSYRVYYRVYGGGDYRLLGEVEAEENPGFTVTNGMLPYGLYQFAVSSVGPDGQESAPHRSTDNLADPITGWYVFWIGSE